MIFDLLAPLFVGLVGSLHCLGMCGPLIIAYSLHLKVPEEQKNIGNSKIWNKGITHHVAFHCGRLFTYGLLGAFAASLANLPNFQQVFSGLRIWITLGGGIIMVFFGLILLKVLHLPFLTYSMTSGPFFGHWLPALFKSHQIMSKGILGLFTGFLPCMLSFAMIVKAATTQSPSLGFLTMILFGAGTVPILFFTGLFASLLSLKVRVLGERLAAFSVIIMGLILIFKGSRYIV